MCLLHMSFFLFINVLKYVLERCVIFMKNLRVVFMGTPEFAVNILKSLIDNVDVVLVVTQPDAPVGRKRIMTPSPVKELALSSKIEVFTPEKIKTDYQKIVDVSPDMIVTCAYGQIIPKELIELPKYGCLNVHASLLPKLRGGAPIHHAIMDGLDKTGITIMYMDEGMDSGNIIRQRETIIEDTDTLDTLSERLSKIGSELLIETLPEVLAGQNPSIPQNEEEVTFGYIIKKADERIDFTKTAKEVYNKIRALNSNPGAYFILKGETIKVYEARIENKRGEVGRINDIYKDGIGIGCQDVQIVLTKIKPAGKKEMRVSDYLNGIKKEELLGVNVDEREN